MHGRVEARQHRRLTRAGVRDEVPELHPRRGLDRHRQLNERLLPEDVGVVGPADLEPVVLAELHQLDEPGRRRVGQDGDAEREWHVQILHRVRVVQYRRSPPLPPARSVGGMRPTNGSAATARQAIAANAIRPSPGSPKARPASGVPTSTANTAHALTNATAAPGASGRSRCAASKIAANGRPAARPRQSAPRRRKPGRPARREEQRPGRDRDERAHQQCRPIRGTPVDGPSTEGPGHDPGEQHEAAERPRDARSSHPAARAAARPSCPRSRQARTWRPAGRRAEAASGRPTRRGRRHRRASDHARVRSGQPRRPRARAQPRRSPANPSRRSAAARPRARDRPRPSSRRRKRPASPVRRVRHGRGRDRRRSRRRSRLPPRAGRRSRARSRRRSARSRSRQRRTRTRRAPPDAGRSGRTRCRRGAATAGA